MNYQQWSATSYLENIHDFNKFQNETQLISSHEFNSIGDYSLKFIQLQPISWAGFDTRLNITQSTVKFTCNIVSNCKIWVLLYDFTNSENLCSVVLPANAKSTPVMLSYTIGGDIILSLRVLQVDALQGATTYIDNLSLIIQ